MMDNYGRLGSVASGVFSAGYGFWGIRTCSGPPPARATAPLF